MTGCIFEIKRKGVFVPIYFKTVHSVKSVSTSAHRDYQPEVLNPTKGLNMWIQMQESESSLKKHFLEKETR